MAAGVGTQKFVNIPFVLAAALALIHLCLAQSPAGFVSIDCGSSQTTNYSDALGIEWAPDAAIWPDIGSRSSTADIVPPADDRDGSGGLVYRTLRYFPAINVAANVSSSSSSSTVNQAKFCYTLPARAGGFYLLRATFWYGVSATTTLYETRAPGVISFRSIVDSYLGPQVSISLPQTYPAFQELYVRALGSSLSYCLSAAAADSDAPFINTLELRPLPERMTPAAMINSTSTALLSIVRADYGASADAPSIIRYPDDTLDRVWFTWTTGPTNRTSEAVVVSGLADSPPVSVMQTSWMATGTSLVFNLSSTLPLSASQLYYISLYFAEIDPTTVNASGLRVFDVSINGIPFFLGADVYAKAGPSNAAGIYTFVPRGPLSDYVLINMTATASSVYPPFVAASELLQLFDNPMVPATSSVDASAIQGITSTLSDSGLSRFSGDPCLPVAYKHPWLTCTEDGVLPTRVVSISLSNSGLVGNVPAAVNDLDQLVHLSLDGNALEGPIPTDLSKLVNLQVLNLSNNRLSGAIPQLLASLPKLTDLDLRNNNLSGEIPLALQQKASSGQLTFRYDGNSFLCLSSNVTCLANSPQQSSPSSDNTPTIIGSIFGVIIGSIVILIVTCCIFCCKRRRSKSGKQAAAASITTVSSNQGDKPTDIQYSHGHDLSHTKVLEATNVAHVFTFEDITTVTDHFSAILGKGGFGFVYRGTLANGVEVAVKVMSEQSQHGAEEFLNEVTLLSRVHHKNLVGLIGYCIDKKLILVYEYMSNGSLFDSLLGSRSQTSPLTWIQRLRILSDAAQGLAYLHHGCSSLIIHRDVKSSNILMNTAMEGKMSDFGISKLKSNDGRLHDQLTTKLMGTMGYIDPVYVATSIVSEKIDIYSFGVVLFEAICGKPPIIKDYRNPMQETAIMEWVRPYYERGAIEEIVDAKMGDYNVSSMWRVAEVAMACTQSEGRRRPTMNQVCNDLLEAVRLEVGSELDDQNNIFSATSTNEGLVTHSTAIRAR